MPAQKIEIGGQVIDDPETIKLINESRRIQREVFYAHEDQKNNPENEKKLRETLLEEIKNKCLEAYCPILATKIFDFATPILERTLALILNFETEAIAFLANDPAKAADLLAKFDNDKLNMIFFLPVNAKKKFAGCDFDTRKNFLEDAKSFIDLKKLILGEEFDETRIGSD